MNGEKRAVMNAGVTSEDMRQRSRHPQPLVDIWLDSRLDPSWSSGKPASPRRVDQDTDALQVFVDTTYSITTMREAH